MSLWSKISETTSFFWIFLCRNSSFTKTTDSCFFLLKKYLIVVNLSHNTLSLNHYIMYVCCWQRNQKQALLLRVMKTLLLLLAKSPSAKKFCFLICFQSFLRFFRFRFLAYWDHYCKFAGFDSLKPLKKY